MVRSLGDLAKDLKAFQGRKMVVLLSGALPFNSDQRTAVAAVVEASNKAGVAIYPIDVRPGAAGIGVGGDGDGSTH